MQFSTASCHFILLRSKQSPKHPVLKHPHSMLLLPADYRNKLHILIIIERSIYMIHTFRTRNSPMRWADER
jgi:hypothetical protein